MAQGIIPLKCNKSKPWAGEVRWKATPDMEKNASSVEASCYVWRTDSGTSFGNAPFYGRVSIGEEEKVYTFSRVTPEHQFIGSCWAMVPHDENGNGKVRIRGRSDASDSNMLTGSYVEGSEEVTLDEIVQATPSRIQLSSDRVEMGKGLLITLDRDRPDCIHELSYSFMGTTGTISSRVEGSFLWTVPDLSALCGLSGVCTITCRTFLGKKDLGTTEASVTLAVPEGTKAILESATLGKEALILCKRNSAAYSLTLSVILQQQEYAVGSLQEDSFYWTPPYTLAGAMPDQKELTGLLRCRTYNGEVLVGTLDSPIRLTVPENDITRPWIQHMLISPDSETISSNLGFIRGKTGLKAEIEGASDYSSVAEYHVTAGRAEAWGSPAVIPVLLDSGQVPVTVTVTDLRGFSYSAVQEIRVTPYEKPRVVPFTEEAAVICRRCDRRGVVNPQGDCLEIKAGVSHTEIAPQGQDLNPCRLRYRIRAGDQPFSPWTDLLYEAETETDCILTGEVPSLRHTYTVEVQALDALGEETTMVFTMGMEAVSFALYDGVDGAAFGKYPESPHVVDLAPQMTLLVRGKLDLRGEQWQDLGLNPQVPPPSEARGNVDGCRMRIRGENHVFIRFSSGLPPEYLAVNSSPVPENLRPKRPVTALCPSEGGMVQVTVEPDGCLYLKKLYGPSAPGWVEGAVDYFL